MQKTKLYQDLWDQSSEFVKSYIETALWLFHDNSCVSKIAIDSFQKMIADCEKFQQDNAELLSEFYTKSDKIRAGHCFWLNRNGHGSGFWDEQSCSKELGKKLSDACHAFQPCDLIAGDDKLIHLE